jgi:hypothetical protein
MINDAVVPKASVTLHNFSTTAACLYHVVKPRQCSYVRKEGGRRNLQNRVRVLRGEEARQDVRYSFERHMDVPLSGGRQLLKSAVRVREWNQIAYRCGIVRFPQKPKFGIW